MLKIKIRGTSKKISKECVLICDNATGKWTLETISTLTPAKYIRYASNRKFKLLKNKNIFIFSNVCKFKLNLFIKPISFSVPIYKYMNTAYNNIVLFFNKM